MNLNRIAIVGAGATGRVLADSLHRAGFDVRLLRRGTRTGLPCDAAILCVRSADTLSALRTMRPFVGPQTSVLSVQNGMSHVAPLKRAFGRRAVFGAAYFGARIEQGKALRTGGDRIDVGIGADAARSRALAAALRRAGWRTRLADESSVLWTKLVLNASINPLGALAGCRNGELVERPALKDLLERAAAEAARLCPVEPLMKSPGRAAVRLCRTTRANLNSMARDLEDGRPTELEAILPPLLRRSPRSASEAPVLHGLYRFLKGLEGRLRRGGSGLALAALAALGPAARAQAPFSPPDPEAVVAVLEQELDRSMSRLRLDEYGPPYFLAYRLQTERSYGLRAFFGEISYRSRQQHADLYVEARYGKPELDNVDGDYNGASAGAPIELSSAALRQELWELTDAAYKSALAGYLTKRARRAQELEEDKLADFSSVPPVREIAPPKVEEPQAAELEGLLRKITAVFKKYAPLQDGEASLDYTWASETLVTSEGTRLVMEAEHLPVEIYVSAKTRAPDGMLLQQFETWSAPSLDRLPSEKDLLDGAERVAQRLLELRDAPLQAPVSAPAIFDPIFTGVFFHEALGHRLEGERQRDPEEGQLFRGRLGERIIPTFLSLSDDPSLENYRGEPMNGYYRFDDEGTPSRRVALIDHGVLRGFLTSRRPVPGSALSNGHGRSDAWHHPIGRMGTLIVEADAPVPLAELKKRLVEECKRRGKRFGFLLMGAVGGDNPTERRSAQTLRVQPKYVVRVDAATGQEKLVRGVEMVGTPLVVVNRALAAGDDTKTDNTGSCGAASGWVAVSEIAPSLLVGEVELQRLPENRERPPILPSPLHDPTEGGAHAH